MSKYQEEEQYNQYFKNKIQEKEDKHFSEFFKNCSDKMKDEILTKKIDLVLELLTQLNLLLSTID